MAKVITPIPPVPEAAFRAMLDSKPTHMRPDLLEQARGVFQSMVKSQSDQSMNKALSGQSINPSH